MTRDRLDTLDEWLRELRSAAERLDEEHTEVREQVRAIEAAIGDTAVSDSGSTRTAVSVASTSPEPESAEASDEDVAAAVHAAEEDPYNRDDDPLTR